MNCGIATCLNRAIDMAGLSPAGLQPCRLLPRSRRTTYNYIIRRYFLYYRRLLSELSRCAWDSLKVFFQTIVPEEDAVPGAVIAIQTFGDFLGFNPHCHVLCTDGGFYGKGLSACTAQAGMLRVAPWLIPKELEKLFRYKVFKMLLSRKKITEDLIDMMMG